MTNPDAFAPSGSVVLRAVIETPESTTQALFSNHRAAMEWLVSQIRRDEWELWRDALAKDEPGAPCPEPGVDDPHEVLVNWFGDHRTEARLDRPELVDVEWGDGIDTYAAIEAVVLDDPTTLKENF